MERTIVDQRRDGGMLLLSLRPPANPISATAGMLLGINWYGYVITVELYADNRLLVIALLL